MNVVMLIWHLLTSLHAFGVLEIIKKRCGACGEFNRRKTCTPHLISDVQYSCFLCCTKFLFSVLYKIPVFIDVQYSCFLWCTIFLKNDMMYLIPVWHVVPSSVVGKSFFSNFECCTIFWCIQVCVPGALKVRILWTFGLRTWGEDKASWKQMCAICDWPIERWFAWILRRVACKLAWQIKPVPLNEYA